MSDIGQNLSNFASRLEAIAEKQRDVYAKGYSDAIGIGPPSGEIELTENGTFDIASYASAKVNVVASDSEYIPFIEGTATTLKAGDLVGCKKIGAHKFQGNAFTEVTIPKNIQSVGKYAFSGSASLTKLTFEEGTNASFGDYAFSECTKLEEVICPDSQTRLGDYAFYRCSKLSKIVLSEGTTHIPRDAFSYCYELKSIYIPSKVRSIGMSSFMSSGIETVTFGEDSEVKNVGYVFTSCSYLKNIILPESVTGIGTQAFYYCKALGYINIPAAVRDIGQSAFEGCSLLNDIVLPDNLTGITYSAFRSCTSLTSINIPSGIKRIQTNTFNGCTALEYVDMTAYGADGTFPTLDNANAFTNCGTKTTSGTFEIRVPVGRKAELAAMANWSSFADNIVEVDENAPEVETIVFYIDSEPYTAEAGMTWGDWIESSYNSGEYTIARGYVCKTADIDYCVVDSQNSDALPTDTIRDGIGYITMLKEEY